MVVCGGGGLWVCGGGCECAVVGEGGWVVVVVVVVCVCVCVGGGGGGGVTLCPGLKSLVIPSDNIKSSSFRFSHAAHTVLICIEKADLPQGAFTKIVQDGSFLMYPEKMPFEKLMDP